MLLVLVGEKERSGLQPSSRLSHEASTDVLLLFAVPGEGTLGGDFAKWTCWKSNVMNTRPLHTQSLSCSVQPSLTPFFSPPRSPAPKPVSPYAPVLQLVLLFLLTSLLRQRQARASYAPNHSHAEPESFAVAGQCLSSQGRGTSLSRRVAVRSLHGGGGQSPSPAGRHRADRPRDGNRLATAQRGDKDRTSWLRGQQPRPDFGNLCSSRWGPPSRRAPQEQETGDDAMTEPGGTTLSLYLLLLLSTTHVIPQEQQHPTHQGSSLNRCRYFRQTHSSEGD